MINHVYIVALIFQILLFAMFVGFIVMNISIFRFSRENKQRLIRLEEKIDTILKQDDVKS